MSAEMFASSSTPRYYCHSCEEEVTPDLQNFTCSRCQSGFIEEMRINQSQNDSSGNSISLDSRMLENAMRSLLGLNIPGSIAIGPDMDDDEVYNAIIGRRSGRARNDRGGGGSFSLQLSGQPAGVRVTSSTNPSILRFLSGADSIMGDGRNYAPDQGFFDSLMTFLMTQMQVGPPPASEAAISELPVMNLTEDTVAKHKTCSICFEDYQVAESATQLPCQHVYHTSCVNTWLLQHATCPVCRKDLSGRDTSRIEENTPAPDAPSSDQPR